MDFFAQYATDPKAEQEGREFDWGGGVKLLIARANNAKYTRMLNARYEAHKHTLDLKDTPEQLEAAEACSHKIMAEVMSKTILLGWTGPVVFQKEPLPWSVANAEKLLLIKDFQTEVARKSNDFRQFRFQTEEADAKNSQPTSAGTSAGAPALTTS